VKERKITAMELLHLRRKGKKIAMITAYDYPSGRHAEQAEFDIVLVGDSLGKQLSHRPVSSPLPPSLSHAMP
jgi:ketopantoate hydroxymethyltransferase